ncbi:MAG: F0F1 ATP synthase subunit delta [Patescibacteria group bacterium]
MAKSFREINEIARATLEVAAEKHAIAHVIHDLKRFEHEGDVNVTMHPVALGTLSALLRRGLLLSIHTCVERVIAFARERANHHEVKVTSAVALVERERVNIVTALAKRLHGTITLEEAIDASLLGGLILETDGWRFDASVQGKITQLEYRMKNAEL